MGGNLTAAHIFEDLQHFVQYLCLNTGLSAYSHSIIHYNDRQDQGNGKFKASCTVFVADCSYQGTYGSRVRTGHTAAADQTLRNEFLGDDQMDQRLQNLCHQPAEGCSQENGIANKQTVQKIKDVAKEANVKMDKPVFMEKVWRFKNDELKHIEKNLYSIPYKKYENENLKNIHLFLANNQYSEIENIAIKIVKLVKNEGYRYRDISIITKNLDTYSNLCKVIFNKYQIPVFIDEKKDLSQNIIVKYLLSILEIFAKNWSYESVFNYIKTGFLDIEPEEIYALENYCLKWGIKYSKWYKGEWNFHDEDDINRAQIERFREIRKIIVNPLIKFKENLLGTNSAKEITKRLYEFLIENEIDRKLEEKREELLNLNKVEIATEYETSWKIIMQVLLPQAERELF